MSDILIAYFSKRGSNYVGGSVVELEKGNTEVVAEKIQNMTNADIFHIKTVKEYPDDYYAVTEVAKDELNNNERPELTGKVEDISKYDTIILCYPNWWGTFPVAVMTFLETYDLSDKKILPLCTHEGSGMGNSEKDLKTKFCPNSEIAKGLALYGNAVSMSGTKIANWLRENGIAIQD